MEKIILLALISILPAGFGGYSALPAQLTNDQWIVRQTQAYSSIKTDEEMNMLLKELHNRFPKFEERLRAIALIRVGTPYELGCLGEGKGRDNQPVFRWDVTDCTVFVLTNSALAHGKTVAEAAAWMEKLNYYNPRLKDAKEVVSYENRHHFTYDRLHTNSYFEDITVRTGRDLSLQCVTVTLNIKKDGTKLLEVPFQKEVTAYYIPTKEITPELLKKLPCVCGVAFIRKKSFDLGVVVAHEGIIIDKKQLIEADSVDKKVMNYDFMDFYFNICNTAKKGDSPDLWFDGIIIYKLK